MKIEKLHRFHDATYAENWANKFNPDPERIRIFEMIRNEIQKWNPESIVLELGIGPGYLAEYLMRELPEIQYVGADYSKAMLDLSTQRTLPNKSRIHLHKVDLMKSVLTEHFSGVDVVVTTWTLHDLFSEKNIQSVYEDVKALLGENGILLNGDFIKPDNTSFDYEGGRLTCAKHIELLKRTGFSEAICLDKFETNIENPTPANNYACFKAIAG